MSTSCRFYYRPCEKISEEYTELLLRLEELGGIRSGIISTSVQVYTSSKASEVRCYEISIQNSNVMYIVDM